MRRLWITALLIFAIDQITKYWVVQVLDLKTRLNLEVLPPLLNLRMAWNRGINFGWFSGDNENARWILIAIAVAICVAVLVWVRRENAGPMAYISAGVLIGGALGNVVDRIIYGAVADFLNMSCCGVRNPFSFNVADIAVFAGAIGLVIWGEARKTGS
ncbi:MAG: signal peptidase II [Pseudomonadota bacterium]